MAEWIRANEGRLGDLEGSEISWDFDEKFGSIGICEPPNILGHWDKNDVGYRLPVELTDKQILEAVEKSVKEDHDYLLDLIGKPENKVPEYDPDCDY